MWPPAVDTSREARCSRCPSSRKGAGHAGPGRPVVAMVSHPRKSPGPGPEPEKYERPWPLRTPRSPGAGFAHATHDIVCAFNSPRWRSVVFKEKRKHPGEKAAPFASDLRGV